MLNLERYDRQIKLKSFGIEAQKKLTSAKVLVIGAGGLGCPALQYLTAAGIGNIGIIDDDKISLSNLHRQILYTSNDIGKMKTEVAYERLSLMNPDVKINFISERISTNNAAEIISNHDIIIDCSDNFPTRYMLDDVCRLMKKTLIFGAIYQFEGQVAIFNVLNNEGSTTNYRNLFPDPPNQGEVPDCNDAGVLGVLAAIIGTIQATEVIKLITGIGKPLINKLMTINILDYQSAIFEIPVEKLINEKIPYSLSEFSQMNYELHCGIGQNEIVNILPADFGNQAQLSETVIIDVRESDEYPKLEIPYLSIPLSQLKENSTKIQQKNVIVVCQSGKRSLAGAQILKEILGAGYKISHLEGGINQLYKEINE